MSTINHLVMHKTVNPELKPGPSLSAAWVLRLFLLICGPAGSNFEKIKSAKIFTLIMYLSDMYHSNSVVIRSLIMERVEVCKPAAALLLSRVYSAGGSIGASNRNTDDLKLIN